MSIYGSTSDPDYCVMCNSRMCFHIVRRHAEAVERQKMEAQMQMAQAQLTSAQHEEFNRRNIGAYLYAGFDMSHTKNHMIDSRLSVEKSPNKKLLLLRRST